MLSRLHGGRFRLDDRRVAGRGRYRLAGQTPSEIRNQATELIRSGKSGQAIPLLERALARDAADSRTRNLLGIALSGEGRHEQAIEQFREVLRQDPRFIPALKNMAMDELQLGRDADARNHFETALAAAPDDPAVHFGLGQLDFRARQFEKAVQHFGRSGDLYRSNPAVLVEYAASCVESGQSKRAEELLATLPATTPGPLHFQAGVLLARLEQYPRAAAEFSLAVGEGTDPYDTGFNLALAWFKAGNSTAAIAAGSDLVRRGLATTELYSLLAKAYEAGGNTKDAYESLRAATRIDPRDETPYLDLIALCAEHDNFDLALEIADIGLRADPAAYRLRVDRGIVLALLGRMEQAEKEFSTAAANPSETEAPLARAIALLELNRTAEAGPRSLRERRKLHDDSYLVDWHLAEALLKSGTGENAEAIDALRQSIRSNPGVARTHFLLGKVLMQGENGRSDRRVAVCDSPRPE